MKSLIPLNYHSPVACDAFGHEGIIRPGAITWATIAAAAWLLFAGIAWGQPTQPTTVPAPKVIHATTQPAAGADGSEAHPLSLQQAVNRFRSGDTLDLHGGETFPAIGLPKFLNGGTVQSYGGRATVDAPYPLLVIIASGTWEVSGIDFTDHTRIPELPGFKAHPGGMGIAFRDSPDLHLYIHDCTVKWHAIAIDVESVGQRDTVISRCIIGPTYGINQRSQGFFLSGQLNAVVRGCYFETCGWYPGQQAPTNQSHGIYGHWIDTNPSGPLTVDDSTFVNCSAAGPTSNSGGVFDNDIIIESAADGSGMQTWGSRDSWALSNSFIIGGFANAIARNCTVEGNTFVTNGFAVNVDVPAQTLNWRAVTDTVYVRNNVLYGSAGDLLHITNKGGGQVVATNNPVVPNGSAMDQVIRDAAAKRLADLKAGMK